MSQQISAVNVTQEGEEAQHKASLEQAQKDRDAAVWLYRFRADIKHIYADKYVLLVTNSQGGTASLEFGKDEVAFDILAIADGDLDEECKDIEFSVDWELAVEKHLPEFLGAAPTLPATPDPEESPEPTRNETATGAVWVCEDTITIARPISTDQKARYGQEMAEAKREKTRLEIEMDGIRKRYKGQIDEQESIIADLSKLILEGEDSQSIACDKLADMTTEEYVWTRQAPPHDEVFRRKMTPEEKRKPLPLPLPPKHPAAPKEDPAAPAEPETVILYGIIFDEQTGGYTDFQVEWSDGTHSDISVPNSEILSCGKVHYTMDFLEISAAYAAENELIAEIEGAPERSCGTCGHIHQQPSDGEDDPCSGCGQDQNLPNWTQGASAGAVQ